MMLILLAELVAGAAGVEAAALSSACDGGDVVSCLALARANTGVGLPVDLLEAREAYEKACARGAPEGCAGAEGIARQLGRHVDLHLLQSVPRVWLVAGPSWVASPEAPIDPALAAAVQARLVFAESCYGAAVEGKASLEGMLDLGLEVQAGKVVEILVHQSSLDDVDAAGCIADALGRTRIPASAIQQGQVFLRLRAEPGPVRDHAPPVIQDHLADGAQATVGDPLFELPSTSLDRRRIEIAATAAVRRALAGAPCVLDEVQAGRWTPVDLRIRLVVEPDGRASTLSVSPLGQEREALAACVQARLDGLMLGETGLDARVAGTVILRTAPAWTATWVP